MELKNSIVMNPKNQIVMKLKKSNCDETQIAMKLKKSNGDETQKLTL